MTVGGFAFFISKLFSEVNESKCRIQKLDRFKKIKAMPITGIASKGFKERL